MMFSLLFIGTGAADFSPLLQTDFKNRLDNNHRRSSSLLINGRLLIDCGPHVPRALELLHRDPAEITDLLITHFHADHYDERSVRALAEASSRPLHIWFREDAKISLPGNTVPHPLRLFETYAAGDVKLTGLPANHREYPAHYALTCGGKSLFYGCDGAWLLNDTFYWMKDRRFDCLVLDGTVGDTVGDFRMSEHNSLPMIRLMLPSLRTIGAVTEKTLICLSHIARTLHMPHGKLCEALKKEGMIAAYDGLSLDIK